VEDAGDAGFDVQADEPGIMQAGRSCSGKKRCGCGPGTTGTGTP